MARHDITLRRVVYAIPGMESVVVARDIEYGTSDAGPLRMDIYYPPAPQGSRLPPAVLIVAGFADVGVTLTLGCTAKEMEMVISWAQLIAASGITAIAYTNANPATDAVTLIRYLQEHGTSLGLDSDRIGLYAASGNVPVALSLLMHAIANPVKCAALCYGFMLDLEGSSDVSAAAGTWRFANPCQGRSVDDLEPDVPLLVVRAGADHFAGLNRSLDRFIDRALAGNLPLTLVNHSRALHAFDLADSTEDSREVIRQIIRFFQFQLRMI
jgi:acetyl esterase/lipase